ARLPPFGAAAESEPGRCRAAFRVDALSTAVYSGLAANGPPGRSQAVAEGDSNAQSRSNGPITDEANAGPGRGAGGHRQDQSAIRSNRGGRSGTTLRA